jgi:hypothetical protein
VRRILKIDTDVHRTAWGCGQMAEILIFRHKVCLQIPADKRTLGHRSSLGRDTTPASDVLHMIRQKTWTFFFYVLRLVVSEIKLNQLVYTSNTTVVGK